MNIVLFQLTGTCVVVLVAIALIAVVATGLYLYQAKRLKKKYAQMEQDFQKAETELNIKNEFIKNLANDLREPLTPIAGFCDILTAENLLPEERKEMTEHIKESSKILSQLIDKLAELSFYESKKSLPVTESMSLNTFCQHMVDSYKNKCHEGVEIRFETSLPDNLEIQTNYEAMERLVELLLVNAMKFTEKGNITLACSQQDEMLLISVSDTGRGIPEMEKGDFFNFLLHQKTGAETKFVGMSFAICRAITRLLGGQIWLDTACTDATRFVCEIPMKR